MEVFCADEGFVEQRGDCAVRRLHDVLVSTSHFRSPKVPRGQSRLLSTHIRTSPSCLILALVILVPSASFHAHISSPNPAN